MNVTVLTFPGNGRGPRKPSFDGSTAKLGEVLAAAEATPTEGEKCELAINGDVTTDMEALVPDGATVTKTKRVEGA